MMFDWNSAIIIFIIMEAITFITYYYTKTYYKTPHKKHEIDIAMSILVGFTVISLLFGSVTGLVLGEDFKKNPNNYCPDHPDECVLVNETVPTYYENTYHKVNNNYCGCDICYKRDDEKPFKLFQCPVRSYRFKTDCEKNPREDADCKCNYETVNYNNFNRTHHIIFICQDDNCSIANQIQEQTTISFNITTITMTSCLDRTPEERCEYFNKTAVYDLNNTNVVGCI